MMDMQKQDFPILAVRKVLTEPPIYLVDVRGQSDSTVELQLDSKTLLSFSKFQQVCMEYANVVPKHVPWKVWTSMIHDAISKAEHVRPPADLSSGGRFRDLLKTYCSNASIQNEALLRGAVWHDKQRGRYWFTIEGLQKHLAQQNVKMDRSQIWASIRKVHGSDDPRFHPKEFMCIKERGVNAWWVPCSALQR